MSIDPMDPTAKTRASMDAFYDQPEWCRITLASTGDAVIATDRLGCITFLNPAAQLISGWSQDEAAGRPIDTVFRTINEESRLTVESSTIRALRDGVIVGLVHHTLLVAKDGSECPVDDNAAPIRDEHGAISGSVLVFRDISERRRQERRIEESASYADSIIATLSEPFLVLDAELRVKTANQAFYHAFCVSKEETEGRLIYELGDGQWNIPRLRSFLEETLPCGLSFRDFEVVHEFPRLGKRTMLLNARRFESGANQEHLILLAIQDITERKLAEVAVQVSELRYRRLFETARDGVLILDAATGRIIDANPFMTELLGYSHSDFVGKELWEIGLFKDVEDNQTAFQQLQRDGYVRYEHLPLQTASGTQVEVEFVSNIYTVDRHSVAQCNIRDIGARTRSERQAKEQAEVLATVNRGKDEFLAVLSHELRNPLAPIANAVQLLRMHRADGEIHEQALTIIERQVAQLVRLVDDLLEMARISTGRFKIRKARVTVGGIVERAVEVARPLIDQRKETLTVSVPAEPIFLFADADRLVQVFVNLLTNAAKYTDDGGRIWMTVDRAGDDVYLRVRDTGMGIAPDVLPRIFDLFTQAERSLDRSQGGLGIGLSLVQRLVEVHQGSIKATSILGEGSEFVVRLPVMATPPPEPRPRRVAGPSDASSGVVPATGPRLRVLVVDDNPDAAQSMALLLKSAGHEVRTASSGPTAMAVAVEQEPDVIVLDIGLPGFDGYEVARRIRRLPNLRNRVLVALTGYGQEGDLQHSKEMGFDHHLVKPASFAKLKEILASVVPS